MKKVVAVGKFSEVDFSGSPHLERATLVEQRYVVALWGIYLYPDFVK